MSTRPITALFFILCLAHVNQSFKVGAADELPARTALDDYVEAPDDSYSWKIVNEETANGIRTVVIDMVSQTWRSQDEVDRTQWQHWVTVTIPEKRQSNIGMLWIGGGRNGKDPPKSSSEIVQSVAQATNTVVAELHMVPNQPLVFRQDGQRRSEDDLVAYTWDQYLKTGDPTWPARNPMVKSAVRAMDTISSLVSQENGETPEVDRFVVAGGSKRGWTTWLTGAVDRRVVAIIPIVIDVLNVEAAVRHHFAAYGFWAPSVGDYVEQRITQRTDHPRMQELTQLVDPFHYRHRLTLPKYIVNASGDEFFPPDSSQFYFADLRGDKHLRYVPNANHSLDGTDALQSVIAYYSIVLADQKAPRFTWSNSREGLLEVTALDRPKEVRLWQATNPEARDFRLETLGPKFESLVLEDQGNARYVAQVAAPDKGWTAYFAELTYEVLGSMPIKLTSDVFVVPDRLPHENKKSTLPATITLLCNPPSVEDARKIEQAVRSVELPVVDGQIQATVQSDDSPSQAAQLILNWTPQGRFKMSAFAVTKWLRDQGCSDFVYQLESGPIGSQSE